MSWKGAPATDMLRGLVRNDNTLSWFDRRKGRYVVYAIPIGVGPIGALADDGANFDSRYIMGVTYTNRFDIPVQYASGFWYAVAPYDRYGNEGEAITLNAPVL